MINKQIIISQDNKKLETHLKRLAPDIHKTYKYLSLDDKNIDAIALLEKKGATKIYPSYNKEDFLSEYLNLISTIGEKQNNKKWWASEIAAKNRFISKLPSLLHEFLLMNNAIKNNNYDLLVILDPSNEILASIKKIIKTQKILYTCHERYFQKKILFFHGYIRWLLSISYELIRICLKKYYTQYYLAPIFAQKLRSSNKDYYIIKTFIYNHSFSKEGSYIDLFFGSLLEFLKDKKNVLIYGKILGDYQYCIQHIRRCPSFTIVPHEYFLSLLDILSSFFKILFGAQLKQKTLFFNYDITDIVNCELHRTFNGYIPFDQFLHYNATKNITKVISIETFLTPHENTPWERMCVLALRKYSPKTHIIGYQHTIVSQATANMFLSHQELASAPLPDQLLTVGTIPKNIIEQYSHVKKGYINTSCALRFEYLYKTLLSQRTPSGNILVLLQDLPHIHRMIHYIFEELGNHSFYHLIIKPPPPLSWPYFQKKLPPHLKRVSNFTVFNKPDVKEAIQMADIVIYFESSAALEALWMGKPVIHFDLEEVLNYDPLFECHSLKWTVAETTPLLKVLEEIYALKNEDFNVKQEQARTYLYQYFHPVNEENLKKFINS